MPKTIIITGASSGFGAMTARVLAETGHVVYAGMRVPYFAAKAAEDALAVSYAAEVGRFGAGLTDEIPAGRSTSTGAERTTFGRAISSTVAEFAPYTRLAWHGDSDGVGAYHAWMRDAEQIPR